MSKYDCVIIGSGPGGYVAAIKSAHLGLKTAIIEKDQKLGGTCLLRGCIPTKALLHAADVIEELRHAQANDLITGELGINFQAAQRSREKVIAQSAAGVAYLMKSNKIDVYTGVGKLLDSHRVEIKSADGSQTIETANIILATGSRVLNLPHLPIDGKMILSSDEILQLKDPPKSLIVLGAGAVGVEFASIYHRFGSECHIVEMLDRPLPHEDVEISAEFTKLFKKRGIKILTSTKLEKAEIQNNEIIATLQTTDGNQQLKAAMLLVAVGRSPCTENLGLENVEIQSIKGGYIPVDEYMRTTTPNVFAIGDIISTPQLAHVASAEGILAIEYIAGKNPTPINYDLVPSATYCDPEVASVGLTEATAKERGYTVKVGKFPFSAIGKARILGQAEGFVKIVADAEFDEVLGVHIIGPRATDLIAEACAALQLETTTQELAHTMHAHPTLPEAMVEAAHATLGRPLHM